MGRWLYNNRMYLIPVNYTLKKDYDGEKISWEQKTLVTSEEE